MVQMITDPDVAREAQRMREEIIVKMITKWDRSYYKRVRKDYKHVHAMEKLAQWLNCYDNEFMFYPKDAPINKRKGVEPHVLDGLRKLSGPNGYTYYRILKLRDGEPHGNDNRNRNHK